MKKYVLIDKIVENVDANELANYLTGNYPEYASNLAVYIEQQHFDFYIARNETEIALEQTKIL